MSLYRVHPQLSLRSLEAARELCTHKLGSCGMRGLATRRPQLSTQLTSKGWSFGKAPAIISAVNPEDST